MSAAQILYNKLMDVPEATPIAVEVGVDTYIDAIRGVADLFANEKDLNVFYIAATIPATNIQHVLELLEVDTSRIYFIDTISHIMMGATNLSEHMLYVESPTMLENVMLKVEYLIRKHKDRKSVLILDSVNSLAIHNDTKILSEFLHIFVTNLRSKGTYMVVLSMKEQSDTDITNMLKLVCDEIVHMS